MDNSSDTEIKLYQTQIFLRAGDNTCDGTLDPGGSLEVEVTGVEGRNYCEAHLRGSEDRHLSTYFNGQAAARFAYVPPGEYRLSIDGAYNDHVSETKTVFIRAGQHLKETLSLRKTNCVKITSVAPETQAETAGLQAGDLIVEYNGQAVTNMSDLIAKIQATTPDQSVTLVVNRNGERRSFNMVGGKLGINGANAAQ